MGKQMKEHVLTSQHLTISDDITRKIIKDYTREAGVRSLERTLASVCRNAALKLVNHNTKEAKATFQVTALTEKIAEEILGPPRFGGLQLPDELPVGVSMGLAWTPVGGEVLIIESLKMPGKGNIRLTGSLGDVMKESVFTALSWIRAHDRKLQQLLWTATGLNVTLTPKGSTDDEHLLSKSDLHIHFPSGAVKKDGPSAGVAIVAALTSLLSGCRARRDTAMTGEISLRGAVLPVGGIKEKLLAAHAAGVTRIVLPAENEKAVRDSLKIFLVSDITEALEAIFQTRSGNNLKTSLGADILNSLAPRQSGVTARSSDDTATAMDSCHPRFVSLL